jgi:bacterial/archaeal transporter family-2 protein
MALVYLLLAVAAGSLIPIQAGVNASLRTWLDHPLLAAVTNFLVGLTVLVSVAVLTRVPLPAGQQIARTPWWCWVGGSMGAVLVLSGVMLSHRLGAATFVGCIILGQLVASVLLDHFALVGFPQHSLSVGRVVGVLLLVAGVYVIRAW